MSMIPWGLLFKLAGVLAVVAVIWAHFAEDRQTRLSLQQWKDSHSRWQAAHAREKAAREAEAANREAERRGSLAAAGKASLACETRVAEARRSAAAINRLVSRPPAVNPVTRCPEREVIGRDELAGALGE